MLADMAMQVEAARSLVYDCAGIAAVSYRTLTSGVFRRGFDGKMLCQRRRHESHDGAVQIF